MGQPVALLIFEQFDGFDQAQLVVRDAAFVKVGEKTGPVVMPNSKAVQPVRRLTLPMFIHHSRKDRSVQVASKMGGASALWRKGYHQS